MICPACGAYNLPGADRCDECLLPLTKLDIPLPTEGLQKRLMEDTIADLKPKPAVTVAPEAPVEEAVELLKNKSVGCVLVMEEEIVVGILSERDVLYKLGGMEASLGSVRISEVMTPNPVTMEAEESIRFVLHQMSVEGFRHIPVVSHDHPPRIVSVRAVLDYLQHSMEDASAESASR